MKNSPFVLSALVAATLAGAAFGDHYNFKGTATAAGSAESTDLMSSTLWTNGLGAAAAPSAGNDYLVNGGRYCGFSGGTATDFPGDSLTLGDDTTTGYLSLRGGDNKTCTIPSLKIVNGGIYIPYAYSIATIAGSITLPEKEVSIGTADGWNNALTISASLHGSGNLYVYNDGWSTGSSTFSLKLVGDASDYTGTLKIGNPSRDYIYGPVPVFMGDKAPRKAILRPTGAISACGYSAGYGHVQLDSLSLDAMSTLRIYVSDTTNTTFTVQNLTLPSTGQIRVSLCALPTYNLNVRRIPILRVPVGQGLSTEAFTLSGGTLEMLEGHYLECGTEGGYDVLYLVVMKYTRAKTADGWGQTSWLPDWASHWYGLANGTTLDPEMTFLNWTVHTMPPQNGGTFGGKRLVLSSANVRMELIWGVVNVPDLILLSGVEFRVYRNSALAGAMTVYNGTVNFNCAGNTQSHLHSTLRGGGTLAINGGPLGSSSNDGRHTMWLTGTNGTFTGKIRLSNTVNHYLTNMTVVVTNAIALGGTRSAFAYDAFAMDNWSRLRVNGTTAFDEPTRGFYVSGNAYVDVVDATNTFTLGSQTTMAGQLVKEGAGTLALGGTLKFTSKESATPLAGTNILTVSKGWIRPASKTGADGLAITFKEGTGLKFTPLAETNADVKAYGLYDVAWATPFDLTATDGKLNVATEVPSGTKANFSFGICTVAESAADALEGNIVLSKVRSHQGTVVREPAVSGAVTFRADYIRPGTVMMLK